MTYSFFDTAKGLNIDLAPSCDWTAVCTFAPQSYIYDPCLSIDYFLLRCPHCTKSFVVARTSQNHCWDAGCPECSIKIKCCMGECIPGCPL